MSENQIPPTLNENAETQALGITFLLADYLAGHIRGLTDKFEAEMQPQLLASGADGLSNQIVSTALMIIIGFMNTNAEGDDYDTMLKVFSLIMDQTKKMSLSPTPPNNTDTIN